ncbi:hypothetical protein EB796_020375 [Bugula neritina]|uniref:Uncharacterized protein n=1 Tax=Bugula neritina TaxID=10212 RepID=A0A7J7J7B1_BUGNE|nr:hypothetical protein EB796_020375 [Bugula neritina]
MANKIARSNKWDGSGMPKLVKEQLQRVSLVRPNRKREIMAMYKAIYQGSPVAVKYSCLKMKVAGPGNEITHFTTST